MHPVPLKPKVFFQTLSGSYYVTCNMPGMSRNPGSLQHSLQQACFLGVQTSECQMCTKNFLTHSLTFVQFYPLCLGLMPLFLCAHDCSQIAVDSNRDRLGNSCCVGWKTLSFFHPSSICALFPKKISHFPLDFLMYFLCTPSRTQGTPQKPSLLHVRSIFPFQLLQSARNRFSLSLLYCISPCILRTTADPLREPLAAAFQSCVPSTRRKEDIFPLSQALSHLGILSSSSSCPFHVMTETTLHNLVRLLFLYFALFFFLLFFFS